MMVSSKRRPRTTKTGISQVIEKWIPLPLLCAAAEAELDAMEDVEALVELLLDMLRDGLGELMGTLKDDSTAAAVLVTAAMPVGRLLEANTAGCVAAAAAAAMDEY